MLKNYAKLKDKLLNTRTNCWDTHGPTGFPLIWSSGSQKTDSWYLYLNSNEFTINQVINIFSYTLVCRSSTSHSIIFFFLHS